MSSILPFKVVKAINFYAQARFDFLSMLERFYSQF